jgi:hypothetical protein
MKPYTIPTYLQAAFLNGAFLYASILIAFYFDSNKIGVDTFKLVINQNKSFTSNCPHPLPCSREHK